MRSETQPYSTVLQFWNDKMNFSRVFVTVSPRRPWDRGWVKARLHSRKIGTNSVHVASRMCQNCKNVFVLQDICIQQLHFHTRNATCLISISGCLEHMLYFYTHQVTGNNAGSITLFEMLYCRNKHTRN